MTFRGRLLCFSLSITSATMTLACGAPSEPCPDDSPPPLISGTSGAEAPGPAAAITSMDGRWYLLEADGTDVEVVLQLSGNVGTAQSVDGDRPMNVRAEQRPNGAWKVVFTDDSGDESHRMRVLFFPTGPDSAIAVADRMSDVVIARREAPPPAYLDGRWEVTRPTARSAPFSAIEVRGRSVQIEGSQTGATQGELAGLVRNGASDDIVFTGLQRDQGEATWVQLHRISNDVILVMAAGDDDYLVLHRPGARPTWLIDPNEPSSRPSVVSPPPPG